MLLNIAIILLLAVGVPFGWLAAVNNDLEAMDPDGKGGDVQKRAALFRIIGPFVYILAGAGIVFCFRDLGPVGAMLFTPFFMLFINLFGRITKLPQWYVISSIVLSNVFALLVIYFSYLEMVAASAGANP